MGEPTDHYADLRDQVAELRRLRNCFAPADACPDMVITATPTVQDGYVVRWYRNLGTATRGSELVSASRNAVMILVPLHHVPVDLVAMATETRWLLRRDDVEAVKRLATHRRVIGNRVEPILRSVPS
jgi:hypothetical protein